MIKILISVLIIGLFLYSKLLPYKHRLNSRYRNVFNFFNSIFEPFFNLIKGFINPFQVGTGLSVDMTQIVLLILLLIISNLF